MEQEDRATLSQVWQAMVMCASCGEPLPNRRLWYHFLEVGPQTYRRVCEDARRCESSAPAKLPVPSVSDLAEEDGEPPEASGPQLTLL